MARIVDRSSTAVIVAAIQAAGGAMADRAKTYGYVETLGKDIGRVAREILKELERDDNGS